MTPQDAALLASLTGYTPGPWTGWNMIHADTGLPMTPDELGEMVKNNVLQSIKNGGSAERFMFVSGETPTGPADMCHVGNGPNGLRNTALIAAAPDLHRIATELAAENKRLKGHLEQAAHRLDWCAMVMPTKNYRNTVDGWRDEADAASERKP